MRKRLLGSVNDNKIYGTSGSDEIYGKGGGYTIYGGYGSGYLYGDERTDTLKGIPGNDYIHAEMESKLDYVDCGSSSGDVASLRQRRTDEVSNCEIENPPVG